MLLIFCSGLKTLGGCANYDAHIVQAVACDSQGRQEEIKFVLDVEEHCAHTGIWVDVQLFIKSSHGSCDAQRGLGISEHSWRLYFINQESVFGLTAAMWKNVGRLERGDFGEKPPRFLERCSSTIRTRPDVPVVFTDALLEALHQSECRLFF